MSISITTLAENTVAMGVGTMGEHGLAYGIRTPDRTILYDTGQGLVLESNATALGFDLDQVDTVVFSHGHYDHTGGFPTFMEKRKNFDVLAHPDAFHPKYVGFGGSDFFPIGAPVTTEDLKQHPMKVTLTEKPTEFAPGILTTGEIPMITPFEKIEPTFFTDNESGDKISDPLKDDLPLVADTSSGLVIMLGCTHRGLINTLTHIQDLLGKKKIHAITGGLHLMPVDEQTVAEVIDALKAFEFDRMTVSHCTGMRAAVALYNAFPGKIFFDGVGHTFVV